MRAEGERTQDRPCQIRVRDVEERVVDTLGPGTRAVVWVQGCTVGCPGCMVPESWPHRGGAWHDPVELASGLAAPGVDGLTLSGGEPTEQAEGAAWLLREARARGLNTWVYTGRTLEELVARQDPWIDRMLSVIDVLVDGPFVRELAGAYVLRGSRNQRVIRLTDRIGEESIRRCAPGAYELRTSAEGRLRLVGIPEPGAMEAIVRRLQEREFVHEARWGR